MVPQITRRKAIIAGSSLLLPLSGCAQLNDDTYDVNIHIINNTPSEQEFFTELTYNEDTQQFGKVLSLSPATAQRITREVPRRTYTIKTNVDDITPRPEQTTELEITQNECQNSIYCSLEFDDEDYALGYAESSCHGNSNQSSQQL